MLTASCGAGGAGGIVSAQSFTAQFEAPGGHVQLDYADPDNFRFRTDTAGLETTVINGDIYVVWPSGSRLVAWHVGHLKPIAPSPKNRLLSTGTRPTAATAAAVNAWKLKNPPRDLDLAAAGPFGSPMTFTVAPQPKLAAAQRNIADRLNTAMDMSLCGDAVSAVTAWWPAQVTGSGYAILATAGGIRLGGPLAPLAEKPRLPDRAEIIQAGGAR